MRRDILNNLRYNKEANSVNVGREEKIGGAIPALKKLSPMKKRHETIPMCEHPHPLAAATVQVLRLSFGSLSVGEVPTIVLFMPLQAIAIANPEVALLNPVSHPFVQPLIFLF